MIATCVSCSWVDVGFAALVIVGLGDMLKASSSAGWFVNVKRRRLEFVCKRPAFWLVKTSRTSEVLKLALRLSPFKSSEMVSAAGFERTEMEVSGCFAKEFEVFAYKCRRLRLTAVVYWELQRRLK